MMKLLNLLTVLVFLLGLGDAADQKANNRQKDLEAVQNLQPLIDGPNVFFWRPQKVGSSTLLSLLMSFGYRYNYLPKRKTSSNAYCRLFAKCAMLDHNFTAENITRSHLESYVMQRVPGTPTKNNKQPLSKKDLDAERLSTAVGYKISLSHEMCNLNARVIESSIACTFSKLSDASKAVHSPVRELFMLREPLSRAISVYYFWGELYKMKHGAKRRQPAYLAGQEPSTENEREGHIDEERVARRRDKKSRAEAASASAAGAHGRNLARGDVEIKLGQTEFSEPLVVHGQRFQYHGQESTAPSLDIAMRYANHTIYRPGMPGPSNTWSAFADNLPDALAVVQSDRLCTIVLERLHESLVVAAHYLGWSLADVVVVKPRKALSTHPKYTAWPQPAVEVLRAQLNAPSSGEFAMYNASVRKLDERIAALHRAGVNVPAEVAILQALQKRATEICLNDDYLVHYRDLISAAGLPAHPSQNKLRDVEEKYLQGGHMFSFNREILMSFDVCGPCEAHAMLLSVKLGLAQSIETALPLAKLARKLRKDNPIFAKCPLM